MNTKEAIEFCKDLKDFHNHEWTDWEKEKEELDRIIALLKRGEAFEKIVEVIKDWVCLYRDSHTVCYKSGNVTYEYIDVTIKEIEQKYFPKEVK